MIKNICGLYKPTSGEIFINQTSALDFRHQDYYGFFSVVFQDIDLLPGSILENVSMKDKADSDLVRVEYCLKQAGLWDKVSSLKSGIYTYLQRDSFEDSVDLSGGEKQKLLLARALYKDAPILILDEPMNGLDKDGVAEMRKFFLEQKGMGKLILLASHNKDDIELLCDEVYEMDHGMLQKVTGD